MSYKIAVASSDGANIDLTFGEAFEFTVYEAEGTDYKVLEKRKYELPDNAVPRTNTICSDKASCRDDCGNGRGCSGAVFPKVEIISDCRCVVCKKIGYKVQKQLEKLAIISFDIDCTVEEALNKITVYIQKTDRHQSLRGIAKA